MITEIGIIAGDIWHFLDQHGEVTLPALIQGIEKPRDSVLMSLGWLAREGHVVLQLVDGDYRGEPQEVMAAPMLNTRGVAIYVVLGVLIAVLFLAYVVTNLISSQHMLTRHQIDRTRAFYALYGGMNLALDRLREKRWVNGTYCIRKPGTSCASVIGEVEDGDIPFTVYIQIADPPGGTPVFGIPEAKEIILSAVYTYTPAP